MHQLALLSELNRIDEQIGSLQENPSRNGETPKLLSELMKNREDIVGQIDEKFRRAFERLQTRYKGSVLSRVVDNSCSSCNIGISSLSLNALKNRGELTFCEYCGRILVY